MLYTLYLMNQKESITTDSFIQVFKSNRIFQISFFIFIWLLLYYLFEGIINFFFKNIQLNKKKVNHFWFLNEKKIDYKALISTEFFFFLNLGLLTKVIELTVLIYLSIIYYYMYRILCYLKYKIKNRIRQIIKNKDQYSSPNLQIMGFMFLQILQIFFVYSLIIGGIKYNKLNNKLKHSMKINLKLLLIFLNYEFSHMRKAWYL